MEVVGYICALFVGLVLGLLGGGGSILAVPIFAYLFGFDIEHSTAYGLVVVGATAGIGAIENARKGQIGIRTALWFGIPAIVGSYVARAWLITRIPDIIFEQGELLISKDMLLLIAFALIMFFAGYFMIRGRREAASADAYVIDIPKFVTLGAIIGLVTGLLGAGGGFIIIPTLVLIARLPMKVTMGTSLMIVCMKSLVGFLGDLQNISIDWQVIGLFLLITLVGLFIGTRLSDRIKADTLKRSFGWFVLAMGLLIVFKELSAF